jgi:hypothetical protein
MGPDMRHGSKKLNGKSCLHYPVTTKVVASELASPRQTRQRAHTKRSQLRRHRIISLVLQCSVPEISTYMYAVYSAESCKTTLSLKGFTKDWVKCRRVDDLCDAASYSFR